MNYRAVIFTPCLYALCLCVGLLSLAAPLAAPLAAESPPAAAAAPDKPLAPRLRLEALLGSKAVIAIDGQRAVLAVGERAPSGLKLLSLEGEVATVALDGREYRLRLGQGPITTRYAPARLKVVSIAPDARGMYFTSGAINGLPVRFLVDTGATTVAMNANAARRLGIDYRLQGEPVAVETASGRSRAWRVNLNEISIAGIRGHHVDAVVLEGGFPQQILLGMSFLNRLQIQRNGMLLELRQKY